MIRIFLFYMTMSLVAHAEEAQQTPPVSGTQGGMESGATSDADDFSSSEDPAEVHTQPVVEKNKKRSAYREREAEGTKAQNRFQEDPVLESKYKLNGQPLEVDTD